LEQKFLHLLKKLKSEITTIEARRKKKRWKPYQKAMVDYIFGATDKVVFEKDGAKVVLALGDENKGFMHILLGHYKANELEAMDIINIFEIYDRGIKLENEGVSNNHFDVYMKLANGKDLRLVLNPIGDKSWVVTAYRKN